MGGIEDRIEEEVRRVRRTYLADSGRRVGSGGIPEPVEPKCKLSGWHLRKCTDSIGAGALAFPG